MLSSQSFFFNNKIIFDIICKLKAAATKDGQDRLDSDNDSHFRYASSSIYLIDSLDSSVDKSNYESTVTKESSLFEKNYVSFPVLASTSTTVIPNNTLFTMPEVITATATPLFYNTPRSKPVWSV